ncbi:MAG: GNAT family N-acetyltransferase [Planctomycetia bacterium]|nr:GNAT family N-acetyltransferase [Planctomycetia bacterium]
MKKSTIIIKEDYLEDAILISQQIPEFDNAYSKSEYEDRLKDIKHLVLTASLNKKPVGFKIGYATPTRQNFYSWMGGVLPKYRQLGVAAKLFEFQEQWIIRAGFQRILVKTRYKHKAMIKLLLKQGFHQIGIIPYSPNEETRILYEKKLQLL